MKVLILGAAGYVGTILRPAFEAEHETTYSDMTPVPGREDRTTVCDIEDEAKLRPAFQGVDSVIYLPYGRVAFLSVDNVDLGFNVNVRAVYKCAKLAIEAGVPSFVYASSLSVYEDLWSNPPLAEDRTPDSTHPYGVTKWLGEQVLSILSLHAPDTTFLALRLILPRQEKDWNAESKFDPTRPKNMCATGPNDTRRLFLRAVQYRNPGAFTVTQAAGDLTQQRFSNARVKQLLGWEPRNE